MSLGSSVYAGCWPVRLRQAPLPPSSTPTNNGRVLYKWVDEDGVTHYGDPLPPEYASQEQHVINSRGLEIKPSRCAKDRRNKRPPMIKRNSTRSSAQLRDKNLLSTYASVQEIERLRDQRLTLLADQIKVTNQFLETLNGRMKKLRADSMRFRPYNAIPRRRPCRIKWPRIWCGSTLRHAHSGTESAAETQRRVDDEHSIRERHRSLQRVKAHSMTPKTRILLGVTGGIAAYKSPDLVRRLIERGADVQVVMTAAAQRFVSPMTFQAVSGRPTRSDLWDSAAEAAMGHIELARWAQIVLIAPASADFIARLAGGRADDLLCHAVHCDRGADPAGAGDEPRHVGQQGHAGQCRAPWLRAASASWGPASGNQACGEVGAGRMWEPTQLAEAVLAAARQRRSAGRPQCIDHRRPHARAPRSGALSHQSQLRKNGIRRGGSGPRGRRACHHRHRARAIADARWA